VKSRQTDKASSYEKVFDRISPGRLYIDYRAKRRNELIYSSLQIFQNCKEVVNFTVFCKGLYNSEAAKKTRTGP